jgi:hypothetical protein
MRNRNALLQALLLFLAALFLLLPETRAMAASGYGTFQSGEDILSPKYFPAGVFDPTNEVHDNQIVGRITSFLRAHGEPSLMVTHGEIGSESFRMVREGYPSATILIVRLDIGRDHNAVLAAKKLSLEDGSLILNRTKEVPAREVEKFLELLKNRGFWSITSVEKGSNPQVKDGAAWILEGSKEATYHIVVRRNPEPGALVEIGQYLINELAKQ